jgi:hypothetical protein
MTSILRTGAGFVDYDDNDEFEDEKRTTGRDGLD